MRIAIMLAATVCLGLSATADGMSRKAVSSPDLDRLTAFAGVYQAAYCVGEQIFVPGVDHETSGRAQDRRQFFRVIHPCKQRQGNTESS